MANNWSRGRVEEFSDTDVMDVAYSSIRLLHDMLWLSITWLVLVRRVANTPGSQTSHKGQHVGNWVSIDCLTR